MAVYCSHPEEKDRHRSEAYILHFVTFGGSHLSFILGIWLLPVSTRAKIIFGLTYRNTKGLFFMIYMYLHTYICLIFDIYVWYLLYIRYVLNVFSILVIPNYCPSYTKWQIHRLTQSFTAQLTQSSRLGLSGGPSCTARTSWVSPWSLPPFCDRGGYFWTLALRSQGLSHMQ